MTQRQSIHLIDSSERLRGLHSQIDVKPCVYCWRSRCDCCCCCCRVAAAAYAKPSHQFFIAIHRNNLQLDFVCTSVHISLHLVLGRMQFAYDADTRPGVVELVIMVCPMTKNAIKWFERSEIIAKRTKVTINNNFATGFLISHKTLRAKKEENKRSRRTDGRSADLPWHRVALCMEFKTFERRNVVYLMSIASRQWSCNCYGCCDREDRLTSLTGISCVCVFVGGSARIIYK